MREKEWTIELPFYMRRGRPTRSGTKYGDKWDKQEINVIAQSPEDALLRAIEKFDFQGCPRHEVVLFAKKNGFYYVYAYYGRLVIIKADSKKQACYYAWKYEGHGINNHFIKEIVITETNRQYSLWEKGSGNQN